MSVIAWDGKTLAADRQGSDGNKNLRLTKIWKHGEQLLGGTGNAALIQELLEWVKAGADPEKYPEKQKAEPSSFFIINETGIWSYEGSPVPLKFENDFLAFGSGRDFALAALYLGKDAREAVEVACQFDLHCGNGIDVLTLATSTTIGESSQ